MSTASGLHENRVPDQVAEPKATNDPGRDERGRFAKGNLGGPGNPHARQVAKLRSMVLDVVDPERCRRILLKLAELAEQGDIAAARLLLSYALGKPGKAVEPDRVEVDEWQLNQEKVAMAGDITRLFSNPSVRMANGLTPLFTEISDQRFSKGLREGPAAVAEELGLDPEDWVEDPPHGVFGSKPPAQPGNDGPAPQSPPPSANLENPATEPPLREPVGAAEARPELPHDVEKIKSVFAERFRNQRLRAQT